MTSREHLLEKLLPILQSIIKADYLLLDVCLITNVGDLLIWQAFEDIKKHIPHKCLYTYGIETYKKPSIGKDVTLVFMGGGNFGDLWERHAVFRHMVMADFPENPIVQLPQSVYWESDVKMKEDIQCFANHKNTIHICLRDKKSYEIINKNYTNVNVHLLPDLALVMDIDGFMRKYRMKPVNGEGTLLIMRSDKEQVDLSSYSFPANIVRHDWLPMENVYRVQKFNRRVLKLIGKIPFTENIRRIFLQLYFRYFIMPSYIKISISDMINYQSVYSTRLHGGVLAWLLGKETYFIDNSYQKISGVYYEWMSNCSKVHML